MIPTGKADAPEAQLQEDRSGLHLRSVTHQASVMMDTPAPSMALATPEWSEKT